MACLLLTFKHNSLTILCCKTTWMALGKEPEDRMALGRYWRIALCTLAVAMAADS